MRISTGWTAQRVVRIGLAIYFIALAFGLVKGTDVSFLFTRFASEAVAAGLGKAALVLLALAIASGAFRGAATLCLAALLFAGSYADLAVDFASAGSSHGAAVTTFWRDFALIIVLLLANTGGDADAEPNLSFKHQNVRSSRPVVQASDINTPVKPLSRRSVQGAYHVSPAGRAVSRQLKDEPNSDLSHHIATHG